MKKVVVSRLQNQNTKNRYILCSNKIDSISNRLINRKQEITMYNMLIAVETHRRTRYSFPHTLHNLSIYILRSSDV